MRFKTLYVSFIFVLSLLLFTGCSDARQESDASHLAQTPQTVLALSSSIGEMWLLAGGELAGVTSDAVGERPLDLPEDIAILGSIKDPSLETIFSLQPDLVLLSPDISSHVSIADTLQDAGISAYMAKVETLDEYLATLEYFSKLTGDSDSYEKNGENVKAEVEVLLAQLDQMDRNSQKTALFLRAYSTGVKAKAREHTVCTILEDIGIENIAAKEGFPLEDLSMEAIVEADPDYILVVAMGDEESARAAMESSLLSNPAFKNLSAVQNDRLIFLSKDLYHYKPNHRWGEAYETLLEIFYPQTFH